MVYTFDTKDKHGRRVTEVKSDRRMVGVVVTLPCPLQRFPGRKFLSNVRDGSAAGSVQYHSSKKEAMDRVLGYC